MSRGIGTVMPCCRNGVTSIKMISSTSITSTIGVTLISDCKPPPPALIPIIKTPFATLTSARAVSQCRHAAPTCFRQSELRIQLLSPVLDEVINQLGSRVVHFHHKAVHFTREVIEQPHRRNRDYQSERRREQCFRNTTRDGRDTG